MANFGGIVEWVLRLEDRTLRGNTVKLNDGAGWTRFGITSVNHPTIPAAFWADGITAKRTPNDAALEIAKQVYHAEYWVPIHGLDIPSDELAANLMSFAVNDGAHKAVQLIQRVLGLKDDGNFGPVTLAAVMSKDSSTLAAALREAQEALYRAVVVAQPWKVVYLDGWIKRARVVYPNLP
jgi:lysozyme family protein